MSHGDARAAEQWLRNLASRQVVRPSTSRPATTRDERIKRSATALARTPDALDILHMSLSKVLATPNSERLRKVNVTSGPFKERVSAKNPAGVELLHAVGYEPMHGHLVLQKHEAAVLQRALQELAHARTLSTYLEGKAKLEAVARAQKAAAVDADAAAKRRASYLALVPAEPSVDEGGASSACVITVKLAEHADPYTARIGTRRFDSDCTLTDLINYVKSLERAPDGEIVVENCITRPATTLDPARQGSASLYALDLWPRGQVQVRAAA